MEQEKITLYQNQAIIQQNICAKLISNKNENETGNYE